MLGRALAGCAVLTLTACGATEVDVPALERDIVDELEVQVGTEVEARCPDTVDWRAGEGFRCTAVFSDGSEREVQVRMIDDDGQVVWQLAPDDT